MLKDREHAIRERAYAIWERHGKPEGKNLDHWFQAETEIGKQPEISFMKIPEPLASQSSPGAAKRRTQSANGLQKRRAKP